MAVASDLGGLIDKYRYLWEMNGREPTGAVNDPYDADGDTLLHHVAYASGVDELNVLVASGANINVRGDLGYTPLHLAAMRGSLRVSERLLELGADTSLRNEFGETALDTARNGTHAEVARLLTRMHKSRR